MASARSKTGVACDTCRRRKSRCDGIRPRCSYCQLHDMECIYRPPATTLETDSVIFARLLEAEARITALEQRSTCGAISPGSQGINETENIGISAFTRLPNLHTAASYRMLDGWPKLRLHMPAMDVRPLMYLQEADSSDPLLVENWASNCRIAHELSAIDVARILEDVHRRLHELPPTLTYLILSSPNFSSESTTAVSPREPSESPLELHKLALEQLLLLSIGLRYFSRAEVTIPPGARLSEMCFALCMERSWLLYSNSSDDSLSILLAMAICLANFWGRPFHSLGLLQSMDPHIGRLAMGTRNHEDRLKAYSMIHFILESDILTELDGFPSRSSDTLLNYGPKAHSNPGNIPNDRTDMSEMSCFIDGHLCLRYFLNQILHELYSPEKANVAPHDVADLIQSNSAKLQQWYRALPFEQQFARDITTFKMGARVLPLRQRELALRYYACVFLLHRPILYFFLHKEMEYSIRPPDPGVISLDSVPWVHESCRDCVEAAALIIYMHRMRLDAVSEVEMSYYNWCDLQMLFAAYLILVQLKPVSILDIVFQDGDEIERLLDTVEAIFERMPFESVVVKTSLMMLRTQRQGFEVSSC